MPWANRMRRFLRQPADDAARDDRHNFAAFLSDLLSYFSAAALLSPVTILPLFALKLTDNKMIIALIPTLASFGMILPQAWGAKLVRGRTRYRPFVIKVIVIERLSVVLAGVSFLAFAHAPGWLLLAAPLLFLNLWYFAMGVNGPAYAAMLTNAVAPHRRGRLHGIGAAGGALLGLACTAWALRMLDTMKFPSGFAAVTFLAAVILIIGVTPLAFVREKPHVSEDAPLVDRDNGILAVWKRDSQYRLYLVFQIVFALTGAQTAIWTGYAVSSLHAGDADVVRLQMIITLAGGIAYLASGWLADRLGNRIVILTSVIVTAIAALWAVLAPTLHWYMVSFIPSAMAISAFGLASFNILMELAPPGRVPAYTAAGALISGPWRVGAPLLGGFIALRVGYGTVFYTVVASALMAACLFFFVREPRRRNGV